ncbi:MutS-related protein [Lachnoclostridium phytofermentans]|uniref:MutS-related protein n=1 Tax=Lachnoclostridium phytofermentans TaxID=66219 RepID=UPI0004951F49|nr:hypothetical protein [Lachnoclostridium phytofermentans]
MLDNNEIIKDIDKNYYKICRLSNRIANTRLLITFIGILCFIISILEKNRISFIFFVFSCLVFITLIIIHEAIKKKKIYLEAKLWVFQKRNARIQNTWREFDENGNDFLEEEMVVESDLDIYGLNSLYQYICTAHTQEGRKILADYLKNQEFDKENISLRQEAVKELIDKNDITTEIETLSRVIGINCKKNTKEWYEAFVSYLKREDSLISKRLYRGSILFSLFTLLMFVLSLKGYFSVSYALMLFFIQLALGYYSSYKNNKVINDVFRFCNNMEEYYNIVEYIQTVKFESTYINKLCAPIKSSKEATKGIKKLNFLKEAFLVRSNPYIHIVLQLFLMYDIHCIFALEKWKKNYKDSIKDLFSIIGEVEALTSLTAIAYNRDICFPTFDEESSVIFEADNISHPLIPLDAVVSNSIKIHKATGIITGSNMSGKTTFMRTIGVNCILAYAGAPVCANKMIVSNMKIFTSMRVQDDVSKGISTFYAEVLRIKQIIEYSYKNEPMLVLIDEIFKGTNSADRIVGATEIIKALNKEHIICLVSTHDFELCSLVEKAEILGSNYHFEEFYRNNELHFDYKIKPGRCRTTNAKHILRMAGLMV